MKKLFIMCLMAVMISSGCGTILGGKITACQKQKPVPGQPKRQLRAAALIGNIIVLPVTAGLPLLVDFLDGGIYKPCEQINK